MTWRGIKPIIRLCEGIYQTGVRLTKTAFRPIAERLKRADTLPKWSLVIDRTVGYSRSLP